MRPNVQFYLRFPFPSFLFLDPYRFSWIFLGRESDFFLFFLTDRYFLFSLVTSLVESLFSIFFTFLLSFINSNLGINYFLNLIQVGGCELRKYIHPCWIFGRTQKQRWGTETKVRHRNKGEAQKDKIMFSIKGFAKRQR